MSDSNSFLQSAGLSAGSGLLNFGLGQIGAAIQWNREKKKMKIQQENALEQMAKSQEYNLATMDKQNEFQIAAEKRANEYNSIGAQVERARQAGVSPLAAIGSGGAGGLMSVSSAPSGATPSGSSPSGGAPAGPQAQYFDFARAADIGADIQLKKSQADAAAAQAERDRAHAANLNQETADKQWYNANVRDLDKQLKQAGLTSAQAKAKIDALNAAYEAYISAEGDIERSEKYQAFKLQLDNVRSEIGENISSANLSDTRSEDIKATRAARIKELNSRALSNYESAILKQKQQATESERTKFVSADTEVAKARKKEIDKLVERYGEQINLTKQQIQQIKNNIALGWAKFGVNTAAQVSAEARAWINPFAKPTALQNDTPTSFADETGYNPFDY